MKNLLILLFLSISLSTYAQRPVHDHVSNAYTFYAPYGATVIPGTSIPYTSTGNSGTFSGTDGHGTEYSFAWSIVDSTFNYSYTINPLDGTYISDHAIYIFDLNNTVEYHGTENWNPTSETITYTGSANLGQLERDIVFNFDFSANTDSEYDGYSRTNGWLNIHYLQPENDWED